jgi:hypothetical protein
MGRKVLENNEDYELKEIQGPYNHVFAAEKCSLRPKNACFLQISS